MPRSRRNVFAALCATGVVVVGAGVAIVRPDDAAGPCVVVRRTTNVPDVPEASGLAVGRRSPGILWSHNDSGNAPVLFAIDAAGTVRGRVRVPVRTRDWEDVSAARCPAGECLYIADIGDNSFARTRVQIYRVPEPAPGDTESARPEVFDGAYADGAHNAEALFIVGGDVFIVTRDRVGGLYRSTRPLGDARELAFERIGQLGLEVVSDAEASPDERSVAVRTPHEVVIYRTDDLLRGGTVPYGVRIPVDGLKEPQGEGVALGPDGMLYLVSEGRPWNRAGRFVSLQCAPGEPAPTTRGPSGGAALAEAGGQAADRASS